MNPLINNDKLREKDRETMRARQAPTVLILAALMAAGWSGPARADEERAQNPDTDVTGLVEEVLRKAGGNDGESLGEWTRDVVERALGRAGGTARQAVPGTPGQSSAPLPAERHAGELSGPRSGTAEVLIFTSLSVPAASWRQWAHEAEKTAAPLVLRGVGEGGLRETVKEIGKRLGGAQTGVAIDPRLFRLFGVTRVPAVVVVPGGVTPCRSRGCAEDQAPPHDLVTGNTGLAAALQAVADEGAVGRDVARSYVERLREGARP